MSLDIDLSDYFYGTQELRVVKQLQLTFSEVEKMYPSWAESVNTSYKTLELLSELAENYSIAFSHGIHETRLDCYSDIDARTQTEWNVVFARNMKHVGTAM